MTTLISVGNSEGERRCDARCYDATGDKCDCCCGGMNHGVGAKQAACNTLNHAQELSDRLNRLVQSGQAVRFGQSELGL